jgi:hypothetical protein
MAAARLWQRIVEGRWAKSLANTVGMPSERRLQETLDVQRVFVLASLYRSPRGATNYQRLLLEVGGRQADLGSSSPGSRSTHP